MSDTTRGLRWLATIVIGTGAALLIAWLARVAGVPLRTLLDIGAGAIALVWLIVLVAAPWNLYFEARRVLAEMTVSHRRGIVVADQDELEARRIARRMLWFALGGHVVTAVAAAVTARLTGAAIGYYLAAFYLVSAAIRPAFAYFAHIRERVRALAVEALMPREDVVELRELVRDLREASESQGRQLAELRRDLTEDLRRTEVRLSADIGHAQQVLTADLARVADAQAADRTAATSRDEELSRRIDTMVRRMQQTVDGVSDHQELQAGLRALVRMIRADNGQ